MRLSVGGGMQDFHDSVQHHAHIYIYIRMHTSTRTCIYIHTYAHTYIHTYRLDWLWEGGCRIFTILWKPYSHIHTHIYIHMHIHTYRFDWLWEGLHDSMQTILTYTHICIHMHIHTFRFDWLWEEGCRIFMTPCRTMTRNIQGRYT